MNIRRIVTAWFFVVAAALAAAESSETDQTVSVAVLQAEFIGDERRVAEDGFTSWLDSAITLSLRHQPHLVPLDRQSLDRILGERELQASRDAAASGLGRFLAAGVLVCPTIVAEAKGERFVVTVEAVLANRGDVVAETIFTGRQSGNSWQLTPDLTPSLESFWKTMRAEVLARQGMPTLEIARLETDAGATRLKWLADDLTDALDATAWPGVLHLRPRQVLHTKEERLLRIMGFSEPEGGDAAAGFRVSSDFQLSGSVAEQSKPEVTFEQTPVTIVLRLTKGKTTVAEGEVKGVVGDPLALETSAVAWAARAIAEHTPKRAGPVDDDAVVRMLAARELAVAKQLAAVQYSKGRPETARLERLAQAAQRAAHLDPTSQEAAYLVAVSIEGQYLARGQYQTLAAMVRRIHLAEQYLKRFPNGPFDHRRQVFLGLRSAAQSAASLLTPVPRINVGDPPLPPDPMVYRYSKTAIQASIDVGVFEIKAGRKMGNLLDRGTERLRSSLIDKIPDDKLDEEQTFWRKMWQEQIEPLGDPDVTPWALIESKFHARRRDPASVRRAYEKFASQPDPLHGDAWRKKLDWYVESDLREAGDPEWKTWRPKFKQVASLPPVPYADLKAFRQRFRPAFLDPWHYDQAPVAPGIWVQFPESVRETGHIKGVVSYPRVEFLQVAGDTAWFAAPHLYDWPNNKPHHLFAVPIDRIVGHGDSVTLTDAEVTSIPWPTAADGTTLDRPHITTWAVTGPSASPTVWIGTRELGLARFDRRDRVWVGRWYAEAEGVPLEIAHLAANRNAHGEALLVIGCGPVKQAQPREVMVFSIDPGTHAVRLSLRGSIDRAWRVHGVNGLDVAMTRLDGTRVPLALLGAPQSEPIDLEQAKGLVAFHAGLDGGQRLALTRQDGKSPLRLWGFSMIPDAHDFLRELDPDKLQYLPQPLGDTPRRECDDRNFLDPCLCADMPNKTPIGKIGRCFGMRDALWITMSPGGGPQSRGEADALVIYRPANKKSADWAKHDLWLGPLLAPDRGELFSLSADETGRVWASGVGGVLVMEPHRVIAHAAEVGQSASSQAWHDAYGKRVAAAPWRLRVRTALARRSFAEVTALLDAESARLPVTVDATNERPERAEWTDMMLYRAMTLAHSGKNDDAIKLAEAVRGNESVELAARREAAGMRIRILAHHRQWKEMLEAIVDLEGVLDTGPVAPWGHLILDAREAVKGDDK